MEKDFDKWNEKKKQVHENRDAPGGHQREVWWISFGVNIGVEIDGKNDTFERPGIVLRKFNNDMVWVIPVTSREKQLPFYIQFAFAETEYWAVLTQVRMLSTKRFLRKIGMIPKERFSEMQKTFANFALVQENERSPAQGGASRRPKP